MRDVLLRDTFFKRRERCAEHIEGGLAGQVHQLQLVRGFVSAARDGHRISRNVFELRRSLAQMIEKGEAGGLLNPDATGANAAIGESRGGEFRRTLVFVPHANFNWEAQL